MKKFLWWPLLLAVLSCDKKEAPSLEERMNTYNQLSQEEKLAPEHATKTFQVADGLEAGLFAAEPDVVNPTNIDIDAKGRVWVCESYNYGVPEEKRTVSGGRIVILEDTNEDGIADSRKVFYQGEDVHLALGIAVLGDRIYVTKSPNLIVFTDADGDDKPDNKEMLFTGMGNPGDHSAHALIFGPDGRFYFNMGNMGYEVHNVQGELMVDKAGNEVKSNEGAYIGGMIFRCNPDGKDFEVLAHNFRNNYELAVDSYGTIWQSDNDDDGNKSCRLNMVMEFGNYGYRDEMTLAAWQTPRTNWEETIPERHWHQNDPGVIPNLIITGAGSPAGIIFYEGNLLPEAFRNQVIHTDAGPNVVWSVPSIKDGAGYQASITNVVKSMGDQWFRPVDVCTAPDGSIMVADWYDPGVGGGAAGDSDKGRIFRISPDQSKYRFKKIEVEDIKSAIQALKSPNMATRYNGWTYLNKAGSSAEEALVALWKNENPVYRARALWLLGFLNAEKYVAEALKDQNPDIRITGIRVARQQGLEVVSLVRQMLKDPSSQVKRELAIALRYFNTKAAGEAWAQLAAIYQGGDRWMLEALGIGAMDNWENCFSAWVELTGDNWHSVAARDIIWRSRDPQAIELLAKIIKDPNTSKSEVPRYFRAFDFHTDPAKNDALLSMLNVQHPERPLINSLVLQHLQAEEIQMTNSLKSAIHETLSGVEGTLDYVNIVQKFNLKDQKESLLALMRSGEKEEVAVQAAKLLMDESFSGAALVANHIYTNPDDATSMIKILQQVVTKESLDLLSEIVMSNQLNLEIRKAAIAALGKSWWGEDYLLSCVKQPAFPDQLKPAAGSVLFNVYRENIRIEAANFITPPGGNQGEQLPPIRDMVAITGNAVKGKQVFDTYCASCHIVNNQGMHYGPELSQIGNKLPKEGLYRAILYPNEGINYDYEGVKLEMQDGTVAMGIVASETREAVALQMMNGAQNSYKISNIASRTRIEQSLMPNLASALTQEQLVDLVEYLSKLK